MVNLKKYFDKIFVINLDKRPDRYQTFKEEMNKYGIEGVERISAVDGSSTGILNNRLLQGEIGVLMSHLEIIKKCKSEGLKNVLILEDDLYFTDEIQKIDDYMSVVPDDWNFIYFGGNHVYGPKPSKINDKILRLNYTVALHCVAINSDMFDLIEKTLPEMSKPVDVYYAELHKNYPSYGFYPNMAKQKPGYSNIQNGMVDYGYLI